MDASKHLKQFVNMLRNIRTFKVHIYIYIYIYTYVYIYISYLYLSKQIICIRVLEARVSHSSDKFVFADNQILTFQ